MSNFGTAVLSGTFIFYGPDFFEIQNKRGSKSQKTFIGWKAKFNAGRIQYKMEV